MANELSSGMEKLRRELVKAIQESVRMFRARKFSIGDAVIIDGLKWSPGGDFMFATDFANPLGRNPTYVVWSDHTSDISALMVIANAIPDLWSEMVKVQTAFDDNFRKAHLNLADFNCKIHNELYAPEAEDES